MFRLSFNLLAKRTTGFTCFPVVENPKPVLLSLYDQTLEQLAKFPAHSGYRVNTEKIIKHRKALVEASNGSHEAIEDAIGCGQAEQLIEQAKDELDLIPVLLETKCWEKASA